MPLRAVLCVGVLLVLVPAWPAHSVAKRVSADASHPDFTGHVIRIHDGESFTASVAGVPIKIRLNGVDAPALSEPYGPAAKEYLGDLIHERVVRIVVLRKDAQRRQVADVYLNDGRPVSYEMVKAGLAKKLSADKKLASLESEARSAKRGLWAARRH